METFEPFIVSYTEIHLTLPPEMTEEQIRAKILQGASELFLKYGFKSITMDDIAREVGISKKTLYQHFEDKTGLVELAVEGYLNAEKNFCCTLEDEEQNPIDFMLKISASLSDKKKQINQSVLFDLKKYFKSSWDKLNNFRIEFTYNQILANLKKGKKEGYYIDSIHEAMIARFYIHLVDYLLNPEVQTEESWNLKELQSEMLHYHLRGITTEKGRKYMEAQLEKMNKKNL